MLVLNSVFLLIYCLTPIHRDGKGDFLVRINVEGMPPSSVIRVLDPVLVVFDGHIIAEAVVPNLITANVAILYAMFRLLDQTG